jgi:hypothetical protein
MQPRAADASAVSRLATRDRPATGRVLPIVEIERRLALAGRGRRSMKRPAMVDPDMKWWFTHGW